MIPAALKHTQEHVLLEDRHAVNTFIAKTRRQGMVAMEVLFEGAALDGADKDEMFSMGVS